MKLKAIPPEWEHLIIRDTVAKMPTSGPTPKTRRNTQPSKRVHLDYSHSFTMVLPCVVCSESNQREHWAFKHKRNKAQETALQVALVGFMPVIVCLRSAMRLSITFTKIGGKALDTDDNLPNAFKHLRDKVADLIVPGLAPGQADGDPRFQWAYLQEPNSEKLAPQGVRITISTEVG